jgi:hypothetical protein
VVGRPQDEQRPEPSRTLAATRNGIDREVAWKQMIRRELSAAKGDDSESSRFVCREVGAKGETKIGHLRIFSFSVRDDSDLDQFMKDLRTALRTAPRGGLVIDIRGNPGGDIRAAERLLQMLAPKPIDRTPLQFINTPGAIDFAGRLLQAEGLESQFEPLRREWQAAGAQYLASPPLEPRAGYEAVDQAYQGPVALIVDGLSYSSSDVFAAGFQDHDLGIVIGTAECTGAGGGNVLDYESLYRYVQGLNPLPNGVEFDSAIRRTTRVRSRSGLGLEDLGVPVKHVHPMTEHDVLGGNEDLLRVARGLLKDSRVRYSLRANFNAEPRSFSVKATGITRLDVLIDDRPMDSFEPPEEQVPVTPRIDDFRSALFLGYDEEHRQTERPLEPVVAYRWRARATKAVHPA